MSDRNPSPLVGNFVQGPSFSSDDVTAHMFQDVHGRWCWAVTFYTIGRVGAIALTTKLPEAKEHFRRNLRRMAAALLEIEKAVADSS